MHGYGHTYDKSKVQLAISTQTHFKTHWHFYDINHAQIASHIKYIITYVNHTTMFAISEANVQTCK